MHQTLNKRKHVILKSAPISCCYRIIPLNQKKYCEFNSIAESIVKGLNGLEKNAVFCTVSICKRIGAERMAAELKVLYVPDSDVDWGGGGEIWIIL